MTGHPNNHDDRHTYDMMGIIDGGCRKNALPRKGKPPPGM